VIVVGGTSASGWVSAPFVLVPSNGVFGRFDLAALCGCHTLNVCLFVCFEAALKISELATVKTTLGGTCLQAQAASLKQQHHAEHSNDGSFSKGSTITTSAQ
jgi:hypothetical protein